MRAFPVFLQTDDRSVVVFGGGEEAAAKLRLVAKTSARVLIVSEALDHSALQLGEATWVESDPLAFDFPSDVAFAYAATGDEALDAKLANKAREAGVIICAADQPDVSDFITPAIVDRDPVVVAIGTEGTAPVLARKIKARVEALLPQGLGALAAFANSVRDRVAHTLEPGEPRRAFWRGFFADALNREVSRDEASSYVDGTLDLIDDEQTPTGFVSFVGAGPGEADLMTLRARRVLDVADVVLYDALASPSILELARREALLIDVGKRCGKHSHRQQEICDLIVEHAAKGMHVVRLKGGDPSIFGRLAEELDAVNDAGFGFEVVPGVTAAAAASASAAAPLTERGHAQELRVITAHGADGDADVDWSLIAKAPSSLAIYMGRRAAANVQRQLLFHGRTGSTPVVLVENAGRQDEVIHHTTLADLSKTAKQTSPSAPLMMLIDVVARHRATALSSLPAIERAA